MESTDEMRILLVWTVFDHPSDWPENFVVRPHVVLRDGTVKPDPQVFLFDNLDDAREFLSEKGLTCLARHPEDDPVIVETWI